MITYVESIVKHARLRVAGFIGLLSITLIYPPEIRVLNHPKFLSFDIDGNLTESYLTTVLINLTMHPNIVRSIFPFAQNIVRHSYIGIFSTYFRY
jgi:hypothetical protein